MNAYIATPGQLDSWFNYLAQNNRFFFPKKTEAVNYSFSQVESPQTFDFISYRPTILPPVKQLFPDGEVLFTYHKDNDGHYVFNQSSSDALLLAGVRPCDLKAIHLMDEVFAEGIKDSHYLQRRAGVSIIAFNCLTPCYAHCFCQAARSLDFEQGADVFITPLFISNQSDDSQQQYLIEELTSSGEQLMQTLTATPCNEALEVKQQAKAMRPEPFGRQFITSLEQVSETIRTDNADDIYESYAQRCFSCGTCNLVCPTCYCFDIRDDFSLDGNSGEKTRHWDACLIPGFAEVAGGHNFRAQAAARQRHRLRRKFSYLSQRFSEHSFCTGCGRCGRQCTTGIDIFDIVNDVCQAGKATNTEAATPEAGK